MFSIFKWFRPCAIDGDHYNTGFETGIFPPEIASGAFKKNGLEGEAAEPKKPLKEAIRPRGSYYERFYRITANFR
jgi:hypothetical protein